MTAADHLRATLRWRGVQTDWKKRLFGFQMDEIVMTRLEAGVK